MRAGDLLEYRCPSTGIVWQWRVHSICLGSELSESLVELSPVGRAAGYAHGVQMHTVWVPEPMTRSLMIVGGVA